MYVAGFFQPVPSSPSPVGADRCVCPGGPPAFRAGPAPTTVFSQAEKPAPQDYTIAGQGDRLSQHSVSKFNPRAFNMPRVKNRSRLKFLHIALDIIEHFTLIWPWMYWTSRHLMFQKMCGPAGGWLMRKSLPALVLLTFLALLPTWSFGEIVKEKQHDFLPRVHK